MKNAHDVWAIETFSYVREWRQKEAAMEMSAIAKYQQHRSY